MPNTSANFYAEQRDYITVLNQLVSDVNALVTNLGLTADFTASGFKITDLGNATLPGDAVNLEVANALLVTGGTPSDVGITSFAAGNLNDQETLYLNGNTLSGIPAVLPAVALYNWTNFGGF